MNACPEFTLADGPCGRCDACIDVAKALPAPVLVLGMVPAGEGRPTDVDRIRDAFAQRLERQRATGDIKGAAATKSAINLINDIVRA